MGKTYLNVGCGPVFDPRWTNVDLVSTSPHVMQHDITRGLPFPPSSFDVVYHSHVLEHLDRDDAPAFIAECARVLRTGGVLRIAIPDLEQISRLYLQKLDESLEGRPGSSFDHEWMTLELIDQLVRVRSGGRMADWVRSPTLPNEEFVRWRFGSSGVDELRSQERARAEAGLIARWRAAGSVRALRAGGRALRKFLLRVILGRQMLDMWGEAAFRRSGEIHRWMYDRVSLERLLTDAGFRDFTVTDAFTSRIADFASAQLDVWDGKPRKPDSLFVEAVKP